MYKLNGQEMTKEQVKAYAAEHGKHIDWQDIGLENDLELTESQIINPENDQKTVYAIIRAEDEAYEDAKMQLTITSQYHDWHNTAADKLAENIQTYQEETEKLEEGEELPYFAEIKEDLIEEYNKYVAIINQYGDMATIKREDIESGNVDASSIGYTL